jgi:hypothetical protein
LLRLESSGATSARELEPVESGSVDIVGIVRVEIAHGRGVQINGLSVASDGNFYGADGNGISRLSTSGIYTLLFT